MAHGRPSAKKNADKLDFLKLNVQEAYQYFEPNYKRYHEFTKFVYKTTLTQDEIAVLQTLDRPELEFNIMEAYIARLRGEFSRMMPGFVVRAKDGVQNIDPRLIEFMEAHYKALLNDTDNDGFSYDVYTDMLVGGFSVAQVYTDYANEMSMDQNIYIERKFDPTLCGFDPMARKSHKGDGGFCFELFPTYYEDAVEMYGSDIVKGLKFASSFSEFTWSYTSRNRKIILICDYYMKEYKKKQIFKLTNGRVVTKDDYEKLLQIYAENDPLIQPPQPVGRTRWTTLEEIKRFRMAGNKILEVVPTNYKYLPLVFFDGNSRLIRESNQGEARQMTRPYIINVKDTQRLKNFAGQSLANELENTVQHKWTAAIESVPEDYLDAYIDVQKPNTLMYNAFLDGDPNVPLPAPREITRPPIPPEITGTFQLTDNLMQSILGTYDAALGINNKELSGVAIMQGAMHSNAAAMPYTVSFIKGLNRVAQIVLDLVPKYYVTPRSLPIVMPDGKRSYQVINQPGAIQIDHDSTNLDVKVEAGVNFEVQKQISLETIIQLMQSSEAFKEFMNVKGLKVLLDNIDIRGIDGLRLSADQYMQELQEQQKMQQEMAQKQMEQQIDPQQIIAQQIQVEMQKIMQKKEQAELESQTKLAEVAADNAVKNKKADIEFIEAMAKIQDMNVTNALKEEQLDAENARTAVNMAIDLSKHSRENQDAGE